MAVNESITGSINGTDFSCSLYALGQGDLAVQGSDIDGVHNMSSDSFPLYYITNCTQEVIRYYLDQVETKTNNGGNGYDDSMNDFIDNGDAFVALIFTIGGACMACWMLCVFLVLSPGHKRKPIMTQISTVFNTVVLTILLAKVTSTTRENYYLDQIKVDQVHNVFYDNLTFRVTNVFSEALILAAFLQVIRKIVPRRYKNMILVGSLILAGTYIGCGIVCEVEYRRTVDLLEYSKANSNYTAWHQLKNSLKLTYVFWVALLLLNYTCAIKSPRKYSHSKKLFPLAIFIWFLFAGHLVICILIVGVVQHDWQNRSWLSVFPNIIEIGILSLVWEWIYDIRSLERRSELMGVLGRRISFEDVTIFQSNPRDKEEKSHVLFKWLKHRLFGMSTVDVYVESENNLKLQSSTNTTSEDPTLAPDPETQGTQTQGTQDNQGGNQGRDNQGDDQGDNQGGTQGGNGSNTGNARVMDLREAGPSRPNTQEDSGLEYEVEYIDDYEFYDRPPLGPSNDPPPFQPAPGFNQGDYWPEK